MKFVADKAESTSLKCQVHVQEELGLRSKSPLHPVKQVEKLEVTNLSTATDQCQTLTLSTEINVDATHYDEGDGLNRKDLGSASPGVTNSHHGQATYVRRLVGDDSASLHSRPNGMDHMDWTLSVQGIAPKMASREFAVDSQNVGPLESPRKFEFRGAGVSHKRIDDQKRELVLLDINRLREEFEVDATKKDPRIVTYDKGASLVEAGLTLGSVIF